MDIPSSTLSSLFDDIDLTDLPEESCSAAEQNREEVRPLWNAKEPNINIKHERYRHRALAYLIGSGRTQGEAAKELGYTDAWVSQICRQTWFQELVLEEITRTGRSAVDELIKNAAPGSVLTLIEMRDTAKSEAVRLNASRELLNRYLGNTTVVIRHEEEASSNVVEEVARLEREADRLRTSS
jgi:hypothetical protein